MTPVTRQSASIHIASHTSRYDYLNAAKKNIATDDDKQQQDYDQECFDGDDAAATRVSISTRTTRNSKLKHQQQQQQQQQQQMATITKKSKTVAFANQKQEQEPAQASAQEQRKHQATGKRVSKRQAAKYDAQIEAVEAADILASIAAAAACASKKERTPPYWTRQHEKAKAGARLQKAMSSVLQSDFECEFV
jgi:hypothetical protein